MPTSSKEDPPKRVRRTPAEVQAARAADADAKAKKAAESETKLHKLRELEAKSAKHLQDTLDFDDGESVKIVSFLLNNS